MLLTGNIQLYFRINYPGRVKKTFPGISVSDVGKISGQTGEACPFRCARLVSGRVKERLSISSAVYFFCLPGVKGNEIRFTTCIGVSVMFVLIL